MSSPAATTTAADPLGYAFAVGGAILFSSKSILIKLAYAQGAPTETLLALRMLVALPVYLIIMVTILRRDPGLRRKLSPATVIPAMGTGILGYYISSYLDFAALNFITAQYGRLVLFTYPFFVVLFGALFFRERFDWRIVPGMLVAYGGIVLLFGWSLVSEPEGLWQGTLLVLTAAVTFAFYQLFARDRMRQLGTGLFTCIGMSTAALCAIGQSAVIGGIDAFTRLPPLVWVYGLGLGVFATVLPSFLMNAAIARIGPRANASTAAFGPIVTIAFAVIFLSEPFTVFHAIGTALVILGSVMFSHAERRARHRQA
ncbi:DMT family transporter [uncultured Devosia sp.]|uniref:DMT family transporter n=1 Tax=uncultured Devosia sp. TaxID=211434 RepID=UPI0035CB49B6